MYFANLLVGFGLGLMHALDADHVLAVSSMSNSRPSIAKTLKFCAHWAFGHSSILLLSGLLLFGLGKNIPQAFQFSAELSVGVILSVLGLWCFYSFRKQALLLVKHEHVDKSQPSWHITTAHAHAEQGYMKEHGTRMPALVGVVHGLAGSAPALALVPAVAQGDLTNALIYLLVFSVGVLLSMLVFGLGFGATQQYLQQRHVVLFSRLRYALAAISVVAGVFWITQALSGIDF